jgi:NAD-dependent DNA ligase
MHSRPDEVAAFDRPSTRGARRRPVEYAAEPKFDGLAINLTYRRRRIGVRCDARRRLRRRGRHRQPATIRAIPLKLAHSNRRR